MVFGSGLMSAFRKYKPHMVMILTKICLAVFLILLQSILTEGNSGLVVVVYEHILSTLVLAVLAFFLEKEKRPAVLSFQILCYAFVMALLQIVLCQTLMTLSLQFVSATYQSIALNMVTAATFIMAIIFRQETFRFGTFTDQVKLFGVVISVAGATAAVLWKGPVVLKSISLGSSTSAKDSIIGGTLLVIGVLGSSSWDILTRRVTRQYPAVMSLTAMMTFFGTIQAGIITALIEKKSSWELKWDKGLTLITILYGGIVITGLSYYAQAWCIREKGPVFMEAYTPLLIVFSILLESLVLKSSVHLGSIIGAVIVVVGLYLLLWAKGKDGEEDNVMDTESINAPLI